MVYNDPHNFDEGGILTGTRICKKCDMRKNMSEFHWTNNKTGRRRSCKTCLTLEAKNRRNANQKQYREMSYSWHLKAKYGITKEHYYSLLLTQNNKCSICSETFDMESKNLKPHVDHCHTTGKVRGILCFTCNTALGKFKDSTNLLLRAIEYLSAE
jgi:Recombination endonuclease VII